MNAGIVFEVASGQFKQSSGRTEAVFLQMNEGARELNKSFVEEVIRLVSLRQPKFLQHVMRLVKKPFVKAFKETEIMRVILLSLATFNQGCNTRALLTHSERGK